MAKYSANIDPAYLKAWAEFINCEDDRYFGNRSQMEKQLEVLQRRFIPRPADANSLPADVIRLVQAVRQAIETDEHGLISAELDAAVEAFSSRVCYDDDMGAIPEAHAVPCTCGARPPLNVESDRG